MGSGLASWVLSWGMRLFLVLELRLVRTWSTRLYDDPLSVFRARVEGAFTTARYIIDGQNGHGSRQPE